MGRRIGVDRLVSALRAGFSHAELRIEAATLTERASHVDELRALFKALQE